MEPSVIACDDNIRNVLDAQQALALQLARLHAGICMIASDAHGLPLLHMTYDQNCTVWTMHSWFVLSETHEMYTILFGTALDSFKVCMVPGSQEGHEESTNVGNEAESGNDSRQSSKSLPITGLTYGYFTYACQLVMWQPARKRNYWQLASRRSLWLHLPNMLDIIESYSAKLSRARDRMKKITATLVRVDSRLENVWWSPSFPSGVFVSCCNRSTCIWQI